MKEIENGKIRIIKAVGEREGVVFSNSCERVVITIWCRDAKECKLRLYEGNRLLYQIPMFVVDEISAPDLFHICLEGSELPAFLKRCEYDFEADGHSVNDPFMCKTAGRDVFGKRTRALRGRFCLESFDWSGENHRSIAYEDMILYQCHLRGYTMHKSSKVEHPGTFSGFCEKIPYMKELGVNSIVFLPLYDFNECMDEREEKRLNVWGYTEDACYFAPKASYALDGENSVIEMKQMVKKLHQNGMNMFMDMHFVHQSPEFILRCLKYYVVEYHVDGFLINTDIVSEEWLRADCVLRNCKFLGSHWQHAERVRGERKWARFNDEYQTVARRYLKSDEGQVGDFFQCFKANDENLARVHYITQKNGFTLRDLVSYDIKHNEANGEKNTDGTEMNYSWNCGQEGSSRKKLVNQMRLRQTRNAFCMLFLGLSTPMLLAGDEFGRTQRGNNNAYCLDNTTTWLDWSLLEKNHQIYDFCKEMICFRKEHKLYQCQTVLNGMDTLGIGAPGVSCHGIEPWEANFSYYSREIGILFYGDYYEGKSIYLIFNFHWDSHEFYLPVINTVKKWNLIFDTDEDTVKKKKNGLKRYMMSPRSVAVFEAAQN